MIIERRSAARGKRHGDRLDSRHAFSFGDYHDAQWMGFSALRVLNEDRIAPGAGLTPHRHANMEILSYVLSGALAHKDADGGAGVLHAGALRWIGAGHGIEHGEANASATEPAHVLHFWIQPDRLNARPAQAQLACDAAARRGRWALLASPDGAEGSLAIRQRAWLRGVVLGAGESAEVLLDPARSYWLHVAQGRVDVGGRALSAGDALGYVAESALLRLTGADTELADVLVLDLPA